MFSLTFEAMSVDASSAFFVCLYSSDHKKKNIWWI